MEQAAQGQHGHGAGGGGGGVELQDAVGGHGVTPW
jgi:hypothetical protein